MPKAVSRPKIFQWYWWYFLPGEAEVRSIRSAAIFDTCTPRVCKVGWILMFFCRMNELGWFVRCIPPRQWLVPLNRSNPMRLMILAASMALVYQLLYMHIQIETETAWETRHPSHPSTDGQRTHCESVYPFSVFGLSLSLRLRFRPRHSWAKTVVLQQRSRQVALEWWESSWEWRALSTKSRYCMLLFRWWRLWWRYRVLETDDGLCSCSIFPLYRNILNISENIKRWAHWISSTGTLFCVSLFGFFVCWLVLRPAIWCWLKDQEAKRISKVLQKFGAPEITSSLTA